MNRMQNNSFALSVKRAVMAVILIAVMSAVSAKAQTVTPVDVDDKKPEQPVLHYYDKHGEPLKEPVLFLATLDTVTKARSGPVWPTFNGVTLGVHFLDAVLMLTGQKHYNFGVEANVSLWNWIFPTAEFGFGKADSRPEDNNFRYRSGWGPYAKLGFDYNFLYKSNPDYRVFIGYRVGWGHTRYDITDITVTSDYWNETAHPSLTGCKADAWYGEAVAGLRVNLWKGLGLGWSFRYRHKYHVSQPSDAAVWFIPGYGATHFAATFSISYTFGQGKRKETPLPDTIGDEDAPTVVTLDD